MSSSEDTYSAESLFRAVGDTVDIDTLLHNTHINDLIFFYYHIPGGWSLGRQPTSTVSFVSDSAFSTNLLSERIFLHSVH